MAQLKMGDTTIISDSSGTPSFQTGLSFPTGHIIQIVQVVKNDSEVLPANTTENLISNWTLIITPQKASSKILVCYQFDTSWGTALTARSYMERSVDSGSTFAKLTGAMGSDPGGSVGDPALSHAGVEQNWMMERQSGFYLDTPSYTLGASVQYRIGCHSESASYGIHIGKTNRDNTGYHPRTASIMIGMEIAT